MKFDEKKKFRFRLENFAPEYYTSVEKLHDIMTSPTAEHSSYRYSKPRTMSKSGFTTSLL